jgi:hypothetical protein
LTDVKIGKITLDEIEMFFSVLFWEIKDLYQMAHSQVQLHRNKPPA